MMDNNKKGKLAITATCVVLGIMLAVQFHSVKQFRETTTNERVEDLVRRLNETEKVKNGGAAKRNPGRSNEKRAATT